MSIVHSAFISMVLLKILRNIEVIQGSKGQMDENRPIFTEMFLTWSWYHTRHKPLTQCCFEPPSTLGRRLVSAVYSIFLIIAQQTRDFDQMLFQCWASVVDGGSTLKQHFVSVSF